MTKTLEMINICIYMGLLETEHVSGGRGDTLFSGKRDILPSGNDFFLRKSDHLSSGIRDILWETGHAILWESDHLSSGKILRESVFNLHTYLCTYILTNQVIESAIS